LIQGSTLIRHIDSPSYGKMAKFTGTHTHCRYTQLGFMKGYHTYSQPQGFSIANNTTNPIYMEFAKNPERAARFGKGMSAFISSAGYELHHIVEHELWSSIGNGVVVDVGGSHGDVMIALAKRHPSLNLIVQDLSSTIQSRPSVPSHGKNVKFMSHDFFTEQPVKNADIYYFRWIFHNWSNGYSLRILRNLIPALKPQSKIVINDACLPEPNTLSLTAERRIR